MQALKNQIDILNLSNQVQVNQINKKSSENTSFASLLSSKINEDNSMNSFKTDAVSKNPINADSTNKAEELNAESNKDSSVKSYDEKAVADKTSGEVSDKDKIAEKTSDEKTVKENKDSKDSIEENKGTVANADNIKASKIALNTKETDDKQLSDKNVKGEDKDVKAASKKIAKDSKKAINDKEVSNYNENAAETLASANLAANTVSEKASGKDSSDTTETIKKAGKANNIKDSVKNAAEEEALDEMTEKALLASSELKEAVSENDTDDLKDSDLLNKNKIAAKDKKETSVISVRDERTVVQANAKVTSKADDKMTMSDIKFENNNTAQMTLSLANNAQQNILSSNSQTASATGSNFQAMLSNQIQMNAPEFAKAGSIVLKDNNQGTINLILHPESLGNVKVSLQISDKLIAGQIVVQSKEAFAAFQENMDSLKQAFAQSGFETGDFNLAMGNSMNGSMNNGSSGENQNTNASYAANRTYGEYASSAETSVSDGEIAGEYSKESSYGVNIVA